MSRYQRLFLWIIISSALIAGLYFSLPAIVTALVKYQLQQAGARDPVVNIDTLDLQHARISKLGFNYIGSQQHIELHSRDIQLSYSISGLLSGRLDRITVSTADITVAQRQLKAKPASTEMKAISLPSLKDIPFRLLAIKHTRLIYSNTEHKGVAVDIGADISVNDKQLKAQMNISRQGHDRIQTNLLVLQSGDMRLLVHEPLKDFSLLDLSTSGLKLEDNHLQSTWMASADLEKISSLLTAWGIKQVIEGLTGKVVAQGELSLPVAESLSLSQWLQTSQMQADIDIELAAQHWTDHARDIVANIPLRLRLDAGLLKWNFDKSAYLSLIPLIPHATLESKQSRKLAAKLENQKLNISTPDGLKGETAVGMNVGQSRLSAEQAVHLHYGDDSSAVRLRTRVLAPSISLYPSLRLHSRLIFNVDSTKPTIITADTVRAQGEMDLAYGDAGLVVNIQPESSVSASGYQSDKLRIKSLGLSLESKAECGYKNRSREWYCSEFDMGFKVPEIGIAQHMLHSGSVNAHIKFISLKGRDWRLQANSDMRGVTLLSGKQTVKLDKINADITLSDKAFTAQARLYAAKGAIEAKLDMHHRPVSNKGRMDFSLMPVSFTASKSITDPLFDRRPYPLQLDGGSLVVTGRLSWKPSIGNNKTSQAGIDIVQDTQIQINQLAGRYEKIDFKGLNAALQLQGWERITLKQPVAIRIAEVNPGVPVSAITLMANMDYSTSGKKQFTINSLSARTLGGEIQSAHIHVDLDRKSNPFTVTIRHVDVAKLLELEQNQGIYGTGVIDGELPFDFSRDGVLVRNGNIRARPPGGKLRYTPNERVNNLAESNANIAMLLQALTDFNYNKLLADVDYSPDGSLVMQIRLQGSNPEFQNGRPVHLNVKLEENVLQLVRSIQLGDRISEKIGERVLKGK